jgi:adenosine/AMP kinase
MLAAAIPLLGLASCSAERRELIRHNSPNQKLIAVSMESMAGSAAGSVHEDIYISDQGVPLNLDKSIFSAVGCEQLSFNWANDYTLEIHYESACTIGQFTNRWFRPADLAAGRPVPIEIVLIRNRV